MNLKYVAFGAAGAAGVALMLGLWVRTTFGGAPVTPVVAAAPALTVSPGGALPRVQAGPGAADAASDVLAALLLAGTQTEGADAGAVFMVGGELQRVALGTVLGQSGWVLRRVGPRSAWLSFGPDGAVHEITLRAPAELAVLRDESRQIGSVPAALTGKALPAGRLVVQREVGGAALPAEMQVSVRRRDAPRGGPVGEP